jgi:hypothetical protein
MTIHEKIQALVGELSDDYLIVVNADGKQAIASSDVDFAEKMLPEIQDFITAMKAEDEHRKYPHHHDPNRPKPTMPEDKKNEND